MLANADPTHHYAPSPMPGGERRLWAAVIMQAIEDAGRDRDGAREWLTDGGPHLDHPVLGSDALAAIARGRIGETTWHFLADASIPLPRKRA
jgi:hypothetical protein